MNKEQILKNVIEKANKNGYKEYYVPQERDAKYWLEDNNYYKIIFSHNFAKALCGEELICYGYDVDDKPEWQYALEDLAISEDRIKYLKKFI